MASAALHGCTCPSTGFSCVRDQGLDAFASHFAAAGIAALAFCRSLDLVDPDRIALWGYSFGGAHVQHLAATEPQIAAAICIAPVVDQPRSLMHIGGPRHMAWLTAVGLRDGLRALCGAEPYRVPAVGAPRSAGIINSPEALAGMAAITPSGSTWRNETCARVAIAPAYRLRRKLKRIPCPVLYCIAEDDDVNPPALGKQAASLVPDGELRLYPGGHFAHTSGEIFERMVADQVDFLQRRL